VKPEETMPDTPPCIHCGCELSPLEAGHYCKTCGRTYRIDGTLLALPPAAFYPEPEEPDDEE